MRVLVIAVVKVIVVLAGLWAVGQVLARRRTVGDDTSDEFAIAVYVGGVQRACKATSLRRGSVSVVLGGVDLDLREATLDASGADLDLSATLGGVNVTVPSDWKVVVEDRATLGGVEALVTDPEELPGGAPLLRVEAGARLGGVAIMTDAAVAEATANSGHELRGVATS
jgi:predicted membrane protein